MDIKLISTLIWGAVLFGPPLLLATITPLFYADANEKMGGRGKLSTGWFVIIFLSALVSWFGLLKFVYLPATGFDLSNPQFYSAVDFHGFRMFSILASYWLRDHIAAALGLLAFPLVGAVAVMICARYLGLSAGHKELRETRNIRYYS